MATMKKMLYPCVSVALIETALNFLTEASFIRCVLMVVSALVCCALCLIAFRVSAGHVQASKYQVC